MMEEIDRFQVPTAHSEMQPLDPAAASISDRDCDAREGESVAMNYKPSPLQVKLGECVWGVRDMWEVNKVLLDWVDSKALQLK